MNMKWDKLMQWSDKLPVSYKKDIKTVEEVSIWFSDQTSY